MKRAAARGARAFITFEGGEAVGKSTQIALLSKALKKMGYRVYPTREPGGTKLGEKLRAIIKRMPMSKRAELLLFEASRAELIAAEIEPRLTRGEIILCDRFEESSVVYQGLSRGLPIRDVITANRLATNGRRSDFVVLLLGSQARARLKKRISKDRIERESSAFHRKVEEGYRRLAKRDRRFHLYNADRDRQDIHEMILKDVLKLLQKKK
jgi:dTMP kinase